MLDVPLAGEVRRLTSEERQQFRRWGYIKNLPLFDQSAAAQLQRGFQELAARLPEDVDISRVNNWHKASRWFFNLCRTPAILSR